MSDTQPSNSSSRWRAGGISELFERRPDVLEALVETCTHGFWRLDLVDPTQSRIDPQIWRALGARLPDGSDLTVDWRDLLHDDDRETARALIERHLDDPSTPYDQVVRARRADGGDAWIRCRGLAIADDDGVHRQMVGVHIDVTSVVEKDARLEWKRMRLREAEALNTSVLECTDSGVMSFRAVRDDEGRIVDFEWLIANPASLEIVGKTKEELIGARLLDVFPGNEDTGLFAGYIAVVDTGEPFSEEIHYQRDGLDEWFRIHAMRGGYDMFTVTFSPITTLKEQQRKLAALNDSLKSFAYIAAHDLQAPLRQFALFASILEREIDSATCSLSRDGQAALEAIHRGATNMRALVRSLHLLASLETRRLTFEPIDLSAVLHEAIEETELERERSDLRVEIGALPSTFGESALLTTLFKNMIANAARYASVPGPVVRIRSVASASPDTIEISIEDNGVGVPKEMRDRLFEPFERSSNGDRGESLGLGLSICRRIAELHHGSLRLDDAGDAGARFRLILPRTC